MKFPAVAALMLMSACAPPPPPPPPMTDLALAVEVEGDLKVGQPVRLQARITNVGRFVGAGVLSLDDSDSTNRYPYYHVWWTGPEGQHPMRSVVLLCGWAEPLLPSEVIRLLPGESFDPFGPGSFRHSNIEATPRAPGRHKVRLVVDYSALNPEPWNTTGLRGQVDDEAVRRLLERVPRVKLEAEVEFEVKK